MRFLLGFIILISTASAGQQFPFEFWHDGKVVLDTGDTLKGSIKYDLQTDIVQLLKNNKLESFSARKLTFFEIFDQTVKRYRMFYTIPYAITGSYRAPVFFELLTEGKMTLLCREAVEYRSYSSGFYSYGMSTRLVLVYHYFLLKENGSIEPFNGKRTDLIRLMGDKGKLVEKYMKSNKLDVTDRNEFVQSVQYYNSLF